MRPLSEATARIAGKSFERKYIALGRLVENWPEIVGEKMAGKAQPVKIHYRKKRGEKKPEATLEIATTEANAQIMRYQVGLILERINQIFGEKWVTAIKFVSVPANSSQIKAKKAKHPLTMDEKKTLSDMLFEIPDDDIKQRLENLGKAIIAEEKQ